MTSAQPASCAEVIPLPPRTDALGAALRFPRFLMRAAFAQQRMIVQRITERQRHRAAAWISVFHDRRPVEWKAPARPCGARRRRVYAVPPGAAAHHSNAKSLTGRAVIDDAGFSIDAAWLFARGSK